MEKEKIERINELARKKKAEGLTEAEKAEQDALRKEYLAGYRANLEAMLDNVVIQEPDGTRHALAKKPADDMISAEGGKVNTCHAAEESV